MLHYWGGICQKLFCCERADGIFWSRDQDVTHSLIKRMRRYFPSLARLFTGSRAAATLEFRNSWKYCVIEVIKISSHFSLKNCWGANRINKKIIFQSRRGKKVATSSSGIFKVGTFALNISTLLKNNSSADTNKIIMALGKVSRNKKK